MINTAFNNKIFALASCCKLAKSIDLSYNVLRLDFTNDISNATSLLISHKIVFKNEISNEISISCNIENIGLKIFLDTENFLKTCKAFFEKSNNEFLSFAILNHNNNCLIYDSNTKEVACSNPKSHSYLISNTLYYLKLQNYFISNSFSEYYNSALSEVVYFSNSKGIYHLKIPIVSEKLDESKDFSNIIASTILELQAKDYNLLFKDLLFDFVISKTENGFVEMINQLESINSETNRNYQIALKKFSFDTLKNDLQKKKEEYFTSTREILAKVFSQVVIIPVSIGASVFATYKVENSFTLSLILFSFLA